MLSLTATELPRFMACNGYKSLGSVQPFDPSTELTDEGNAVHWLAEQVAGGISPETLIGQSAPNGLFITDEMVENCRDYFEFITSDNCKVEVDTSHSGNGWEIHGRADCVKCADGILTIADLKYGWRIVEPKMNWTLISHAIGYCKQLGNSYPNLIVFKIFQPRPYHPQGSIREWQVSYSELLQLYDKLIQTLVNPSSTVCSGAQCYKCQSLSQCPAAQIAAMNAVDVAELAFDSEISNERLSWMLTNLKRAQEVLKQSYDAYEDLAKHRLSEGNGVKGYSIVPALGQTTWNKNINADFIKAMRGIDVRVEKLMTPAQAKKAGVPEDFVAECTYRPDNGLKLVAVDESKIAEKYFGEKK